MQENIEKLLLAAKTKERMENLTCPIPGLIDELLAIGDAEALEMARQIAEESLIPVKKSSTTALIGRIFGR